MTKFHQKFLSLVTVQIFIFRLISLYLTNQYPWRFDSIHSHCHEDGIIFHSILKEFQIVLAIAHLRGMRPACSEKVAMSGNCPGTDPLPFGTSCTRLLLSAICIALPMPIFISYFSCYSWIGLRTGAFDRFVKSYTWFIGSLILLHAQFCKRTGAFDRFVKSCCTFPSLGLAFNVISLWSSIDGL
jgi:hypothetical protein